MKLASAATLAILSGGLYHRTDLYSITLTTGAVYYFTGGDLNLNVAVTPSTTKNLYIQGYTFQRGSTTQATGLDSQELELTIYPKWDNPLGAPKIAGYSLMQAARLGLLDNAEVLYAKLFMNFPTPFGQFDPSPGAVGWFQGVVADMQIYRDSVEMKLSSDLLVLNQTQMPRNLYQAGCTHTVYDAGCTLSKASFTSTGTVGAVTNNSAFATNLTKADGYFNLGVIKFTSGANNGFSATVKTYLNGSGALQLAIPMPATVANGDTFSIYPGCDHNQATCTNKFSNLSHFKGFPYTPVPETLYDGGTSNPPNGVAPAVQAGNLVGSAVGASILP